MYISTGEFWIDPAELLGNVSLALSAGESPSLDVRSPSSAVDIPLGSGFLEADPLRPTASLLMPSTAPPFAGGFIIGGGGGGPFGGGGRDRTSESSEVWVDCVELSSKLSFDVCGWGWRTMCPLASPSFAGNRPYWPAGSMCTMPEACEKMADSSSGTKEGMSGTRAVARVGLRRDGEEGGRGYSVAARMLDGKGGWDGIGEAAARLDDDGTRSVWLRRTQAVMQKDVAMLERKNCMDPRDRWKLSVVVFDKVTRSPGCLGRNRILSLQEAVLGRTLSQWHHPVVEFVSFIRQGAGSKSRDVQQPDKPFFTLDSARGVGKNKKGHGRRGAVGRRCSTMGVARAEGRSVVWCFFRRGERGLERNWSGRVPVCCWPKARVHSEGKAKELGQATRPQSLISRGATHRRSNQHQHLDTGARCRPGGRRQRQKGDFVAVPAPCGNESQHKHEPLFPSRPLSLHSRPTRQTCTSQPGQSGRNRRPDDGLTAHAWKSRLPDAVRLDAESKKHL